jgi:hypothetical protein
MEKTHFNYLAFPFFGSIRFSTLFMTTKARSIFRLLIITVAISACSVYGDDMSIFENNSKRLKVVLFSAMEGKITFEGKSLPNTKIELWTAWEDKDGQTDVFYSDEEGRFTIPEKSVMYKPFFLVQLVIKQKLTVFHEGEPTMVWYFSKKEPDAYTELDGRPEGLICELSDDPVIIRGNRSAGKTLCKWDTLIKE